MNHLSNQQGIDTISAGVSIAFLIYLVENGIAIESIKKLLKDIHQQPMDKQKEILEKELNIWKGEMNQVDDILIIGFKY